MLRLEKNQLTKIATTLAEKATESTYYPLFRFKGVDVNKEYLIHLEPIETSERFELFEFTPNMVAGEYNYWVYQSLTDSDEDYSNMVELELGKAEVYE